MRNFVKALAVTAALVPAMAFAQIANTRHDLSNVSTATTRSTLATGSDQTCIFCHTPHRGVTQQLLWNRNTQATTYSWGGTAATTAGTPLVTNLRPQSMACLSCHDGTVGLGDVINSNGAAAQFVMQGNADAQNRLTGGMRVGVAGNLFGNHPISIAYPRTGGSTYFTNTSAVGAAGLADFRVVATTGCNTPTGLCTTATGGANITIYADGATGYGIECGSCHDVHNRFGGTNTYFLRASTARSEICLACHAK